MIQVSRYEVFTKQDKVKAALHLIYNHYRNSEPLLILTESKETAERLDLFLWEYPPHSFLPHAQVDDRSIETILITHELYAIEGFTHLLWLKDAPIEESFAKSCHLTHLFDFEEETQASKNRYKYYRDQGWKILLLSI